MNKKTLFISIAIVIIIIIIIIGIIIFLLCYNSRAISYYWYLLFGHQNDLNLDVTMYSNNGNDNAKEVEFLTELPEPDSIIFYYNGNSKTFVKDSEEYKKIIDINYSRNKEKLCPLKLSMMDNSLKKEGFVLEYVYENKDSVFFNILTQEEIKNNNDTSWVLIGYDSNIFKQYNYAGLLPADELKEYLLSCIN